MACPRYACSNDSGSTGKSVVDAQAANSGWWVRLLYRVRWADRRGRVVLGTGMTIGGIGTVETMGRIGTGGIVGSMGTGGTTGRAGTGVTASSIRWALRLFWRAVRRRCRRLVSTSYDWGIGSTLRGAGVTVDREAGTLTVGTLSGAALLSGDVSAGDVACGAMVAVGGMATWWRMLLSACNAATVLGCKGCKVERVDGCRRAYLMSCMPAMTKSSVDGVGMGNRSGSHSTVSVIRMACVSCM